jgi:hypothetical protein
MKPHLPSRAVCLLLAAVVLASGIGICSAAAPVLTIERVEAGQVLLTWTNEGTGFVLQGLSPLKESGGWQTVPETPQPLEGRVGVTISTKTNKSQYFRLKARGVEFIRQAEVLCWQSGGTFDAASLLSADSIRDPLQLDWTITGSPPASIDTAGMATLASGPGDYIVHVAARSDPACTAVLSLHVAKVQFIKHQAMMAWQPGATFDAGALLATDGLTNAASLVWSIAGSPSANISTAGVVMLGPGGGSYNIQVAAKDALACADTLTLNAVEVQLLSLSFVDAGGGNGGDNQHEVYENAGPQDWGDGGAITNPVWVAGTNGQPVRDFAACYTCSGTSPSKLRAQVALRVKPAGQSFDFLGLEESAEYFRTNGILSTGTDQVVDVVASVPLPAYIQKLSKAFAWQAVFPDGGPGLTCNAGQSTSTIYTVYSAPVTYIEDQTNLPTPRRLDFCILGVAQGLSNKMDICDAIATAVRAMTGDSYGPMPQNPRWTFYAEPLPRDLDCHHRAALAAGGFGVLGIQSYVHRTFATCYPVPSAPQSYPANPTVNDYMGAYATTRLKYRKLRSDVLRLLFLGNNFEGCVRVEDGSADDGNVWWTIWPLARHDNAKALITYYTGTGGGCPEQWEKLDGTFTANETVPVDQLADRVKIIGGPD